jgi:hypothetical protein
MNRFVEKAETWIEKLKITTELVEDLPKDVILTNSWDKRKLCIHLYGWDTEFIKWADILRKGEKFEVNLEEKTDEYNQRFFDENAELKAEEAEQQFLETRKEMIQVYEEILTKYPQDNKHFLGFFSLWWHDVHHLKQADVDVSDLEETPP